jgi:hypothetical protein
MVMEMVSVMMIEVAMVRMIKMARVMGNFGYDGGESGPESGRTENDDYWLLLCNICTSTIIPLRPRRG